MKLLVSHPTGNANVRAILRAAHNRGVLEVFHTTISTNSETRYLRLLPAKIRSEFERREFDIPKKLVKTYPIQELFRLGASKLGFDQLIRHEKGIFSVDSVYKSFDNSVAEWLIKNRKSTNIGGVYAYEDGALETFRAAKSLGLTCFYDLPIAYWETARKLMLEEAERLPLWADTLGGGIKDSKEKLNRKEEELKLADVVIGPGKFVLDSLPEWRNSIEQIMSPFGSPMNNEIDRTLNELPTNRPLRVLFVGSMGQRKGLGDLFEAMRILKGKNVELIVLGTPLLPMSFYKKILPDFTYEPGRPHREVLELMSSCDIFCLPSIVEGRALVIQEAMSRGLPIIITPNTGGEDLVLEEKTGFLVPIRSPDKIAEKITWFLENKTKILEMGAMARKLAESLTWENYGNTVVDRIIHRLQ